METILKIEMNRLQNILNIIFKFIKYIGPYHYSLYVNQSTGHETATQIYYYRIYLAVLSKVLSILTPHKPQNRGNWRYYC